MKRNDYLSDKVYRQEKDGSFKTEKILRIGLYKAIGILVLAIFSSAGASIWGTLAIANTIPFRVDAIEATINKIPDKYVSKEKYVSDLETIQTNLRNIQGSLDSLIRLHLTNQTSK